MAEPKSKPTQEQELVADSLLECNNHIIRAERALERGAGGLNRARLELELARVQLARLGRCFERRWSS